MRRSSGLSQAGYGVEAEGRSAPIPRRRFASVHTAHRGLARGTVRAV